MHNYYKYVRTLEVVVVWILCHSSVDEGPGEIVHCILLVLDGLCHNFSVEVIVKEVVEMGLVMVVVGAWGEKVKQ